VLESISKYTSGKYDKTPQLLKKYNYEPPAYLKREWKSYPAVRKLEMAYEAAENAKKGSGKKLLAMLSKDLAQRYEAFNYEPAIRGTTPKVQDAGKINFKNPKTFGKVELPTSMKRQIMTISKYTDAGALGGTRGVLKYKFGLGDDEVYKILRSSDSSQQALERGVKKAGVPPPPQERLKKVQKEIDNKYQSSRAGDRKKTKYRKNNASRFARQESSQKPKVKPNKKVNQARYSNYKSREYPTRRSRSFKSMRIKRGGFGGVILGNEVEDETDLPDIEYIIYIPTEQQSVDGLPIGMLEFIFEDGTTILEPSLYVEDIVAAADILFDEENGFVKGEGIGLAGIEKAIIYPDSTTRWECIVHPVIANLELGWSALMTDVYPIAGKEMVSAIEDDEKAYSMAAIWSALLTPQTWKITDVPLSVQVNDNSFFLKRNDTVKDELVDDAYITMYGFMDAELPEEERIFHEIVPALASKIYEFHRLNEFARTFALLRWAKQKGAKLQNRPNEKVEYVAAPSSVFITPEKTIEYHTLEEEAANFKVFRSEAVTAMDSIVEVSQDRGLRQYHFNLLSAKQQYEREVAGVWASLQREQIDYNDDAVCELDINKPLENITGPSLLEGVSTNSYIHTADSLRKEIRDGEQAMSEIAIGKLKLISEAEELLMENAPDSLQMFNSLLEDIQSTEANTEEETKALVEGKVERLEQLLANSISDYRMLLFYEELISIELEGNAQQLQAIEKDKSFGEWSDAYEHFFSILKVEQRVMQVVRERYCEE